MGCCGALCNTYATLCRVFIYIFAITGFALSVATMTECEFTKRGKTSVGLFRFANDQTDGCVAYPDDKNFSPTQHAARACGVIAAILGGFVLLSMTLDTFAKVPCSRMFQIAMITCAEICQCCTFLLYASNACIGNGELKGEGVCKIGRASYYSGFAFLLYFVTGIISFFSPKPDPVFCQKGDKEERTNANLDEALLGEREDW